MKLCDYGCGQKAKHQFKNGKWCCNENQMQCPFQRKKKSKSMKGNLLSQKIKIKISKAKKGKYPSEETKKKMSKSHKNKIFSKEHRKNLSIVQKGKILSEETKKKMSKAKKGKYPSEETKKKMSKAKKGIFTGPLSEETKKKLSRSIKFTLKDYKEKYPFLCTVEELRETKDSKIQVHCKNHECENSKEKNGWFTPTSKQIQDRKNNLENEGLDNSYFYCSQYCKDTCSLYNVRNDLFKDDNLPYTYQENQLWRQIVLELDKGLCQYCGKKATHVHHIKPVKTHPHLALDPENGISFCEKCHYKIGHKKGTECSTSNLANKQQQGCILGSRI